MSSKMTIIEGNSNDKDNVRAYMVKGEPGKDGVSPTITPSRSGEQTTLTIEDGEGTKQAVINDGFSPTVETTKEDGVTTVEITDINGTKTTEIVDGIDLTGGVPTDGVIGFDGEAADIPDGYEVIGNIDEKLVHVGATAPTDGERVWFKKSKNLLSIEKAERDVASPYLVGGLSYIFDKGSSVIKVSGTSTQGASGLNFLVNGRFPAGTYTMSGFPNKNVGVQDRGTIYLWYDTTPNANLNNQDQILTSVFGSRTFTATQEFTLGLRIISDNGTTTGGVYNETYELQLEEGSTATEYEPYVEPSIYVDEEELHFNNYSLDEQVIGKWIDGKPLYRKTITIDMTAEHTTNTSQAHNISNIAFISSIRGIMKRTSGQYIDLNLYENSSYRVEVKADTTNLVYQNAGFVGTAYITIEYTKTTD
jgi:hypothetical protein